MSANPSIKEGNTPRLFGGVKKLLTNLNGGGTALWVPESERQLTTKSINKNGVYQASKDGAYGWSSVYVSVPQTTSVTGKGQDGKQHTISTDPSTGMLEDEVTPVSIAITTPPTKLVYTDGEAIDFTGAVVHKYDSDGEDLGTVPLGEITLNPAEAVYDESTDQQQTATSELDTGGVQKPFPIDSIVTITANDDRTATFSMSGGKLTAYLKDTSNYEIIGASNNPNDKLGPFTLNNSATYDGKTVYYTSTIGGFVGGTIKTVKPDAGGGNVISNVNKGTVAWTMIYGDISPAGSHQTITVSWPRTGDGAVLETTFGITVQQQSFGGASGGGGQTSGGGAGRD